MRRITIPAVMVAIGMVMAACGASVPSGALTSLGDGEGELNLIIWDGYAERARSMRPMTGSQDSKTRPAARSTQPR